ncbi:potassium transporter TrkA [Streptomyces lonarensis]|uniref:Potassium transporter TrkA n=1 Tax=Streptomyces lonarensis TaxID=700599 RepID=A0A7X6D405_9ACTN|nr:potassium transporter TrkA [Streptomyces lonarensis]NJQ07757.1 potassium transporter TrkA [Streptomyces lonarensis]
MGQGVHVTELPGVGTRYDVDLTDDENRVSVVVRPGGTRYLYVFATRSAEPTAVLELTDEQARKLAAVLSATFYEG